MAEQHNQRLIYRLLKRYRLLLFGMIGLAIVLTQAILPTILLTAVVKPLLFALPVFFVFAGTTTDWDSEKSGIWTRGSRRKILGILLAIFFLVLTLLGIELFARASQGYLLWKTPIEKTNVYFQLDKVKLWNRKFYESRELYFRQWPIPIEFFEADKPEPRYLFKPSVALKREGNEAIVVDVGAADSFWWSNSWGFRGDEFTVEKPAGTFRVVCLGASTTEGSQGNRETYPYFLQQELQKRYPDKKIEVINAGHHGQGIADLLEIFKQRVLPLQPDLIIFYEANNDIGWAEFFKADANCQIGTCWLNTYPGSYQWAYENSAAFVYLSHLFGWDHKKTPSTPHEFVSATNNMIQTKYYRDTLSQIVQTAKTNKIPIVLTSFVTVAHEGLEVTYEQSSGIFEALNKQFYPLTTGELGQIFQIMNQQSALVAKEFNVPYADLAAKFPREIKYFPFDLIHFSPEANQLLSNLLAEFLSQEVLFKG